MNRMNERPVCHRAEDLVSYLYGEASADEARDFAEHMEHCESCIAEFASFDHVHESIVLWRNEALGSVNLHAASPVISELNNHFAQHRRKRSARAALREFFAISPLWLRGATAFATLLLMALVLFAISRIWTPSAQIATKKVTKTEFDIAVQKEVEARLNALKNRPLQTSQNQATTVAPAFRPKVTRTQVARSPHTRLTPQERQQLAADLRLIPGREDDLPFVFPDEPEQ